jgi:hypothetical protein
MQENTTGVLMTLTKKDINGTWHISEFDYDDFADSIRIISPLGYVFEIRGRKNIPLAMAMLVNFEGGGEISFHDGTRALIAQDGVLHLIDKDSWENPGFFYGDKIGTAQGLSRALATYLQKFV